MKMQFLRGCAAAIALLGGASAATGQQVDGVTAPNQPGRVYVRGLLEDYFTGQLLNPDLVDSSYLARDAGLDLFHISSIPEIYGFDPDDIGEGVIHTSSNILGTQVWARYYSQDLTGNGVVYANTLQVILPCRSSGARNIIDDGLYNGFVPQGLYTRAPAGVSDAARENIETYYTNPYAVSFTQIEGVQGIPANFAADPFDSYDQFLESNSTQGNWQYTAVGSQNPQVQDPQTGGAVRVGEQFSSSQFVSAAYGCSVSTAGVNPLVGNAQSLQHQMVENALDFTQPWLTPDEAPWGIGLRIGRTNRQGAVGTVYEGRINRAFRLGEGNRALISIDIPVSYEDVKGVRTLRASAAVAARVPVSRVWSVEPRVSYGYVYAHDQQLKGQMLAGTVSSLLFFDNLVGRGALTVGNMIGFTKVLKAELYDYDVGNKTSNVVLRNGLAYELPIFGRGVGQRQTSLRASYALTNYLGDDLYTETLHEATLSMGVRTRGSDIRNSFEVLRVGLIGKFGEHYKSGHIFLGYRF